MRSHLTCSMLPQAIDAFQNDPPTTVFLLSSRSGSVGINLTAASHVFLMEPALNKALEVGDAFTHVAVQGGSAWSPVGQGSWEGDAKLQLPLPGQCTGPQVYACLLSCGALSCKPLPPCRLAAAAGAGHRAQLAHGAAA